MNEVKTSAPTSNIANASFLNHNWIAYATRLNKIHIHRRSPHNTESSRMNCVLSSISPVHTLAWCPYYGSKHMWLAVVRNTDVLDLYAPSESSKVEDLSWILSQTISIATRRRPSSSFSTSNNSKSNPSSYSSSWKISWCPSNNRLLICNGSFTMVNISANATVQDTPISWSFDPENMAGL